MLRAVPFALLGLAAADGRGAVLERAELGRREDWVQKAWAQGWESHEVLLAVKQQNLDRLHDMLMEVSEPKSPKRGHYLTYDEVHQLTVDAEAGKKVLAWLEVEAVEVVRMQKHGHYVRARANTSTWERLLGSRFAWLQNTRDARTVLRAVDDVRLPEAVSGAVAGAFMTTQLPPRPRPTAEPRYLRPLSNTSSGARRLQQTGSVTPAGLQSFYGVRGSGSASVSQAVFESLGQYTSPTDLASFQSEFGLASQTIATDIGGHVSDAPCSTNPNNCAEANLDVQYMMAISPVTPETYWYESNQNTPFEAWIEAVASTSSPPLINSISYGSVEPEVAASVAQAFNTEAMKLGAQGVTVFVSSGDDGVANFPARGQASGCGYNPSFPASSPYVTAVGATQGGITGGAEIVCSSATGGSITTGGGFSTQFAAPSYQTAAIEAYFAAASPAPASGYATSGRGYPDLAMAGYNYEVVIAGSVYAVSGTSASSPVVAAFASLVNAQLQAGGQPPVGFINPTIYQAGSAAFNDISSGNNCCTASSVCCTQGFYATQGWDPVTGFGSVDFPKFAALFGAPGAQDQAQIQV